MARQNFLDRLLPGFGRGDIQRDAEAAAGIFLGQFVGLFAPGANAQPDPVVGRFLEKCARDGLAQAAIRAGDQNDTQAHGRMLPVGLAMDK